MSIAPQLTAEEELEMATWAATRMTLNDIEKERRRQDTKWGPQNHSPLEWLSILTEEVGEVAKAINEAHWGGAPLTEYRAELVQVAAVAVAAIESLDRNGR